jgi:hypothetical protein
LLKYIYTTNEVLRC